VKTDVAHMLGSSDGALTVTPSVSDIGGDRRLFGAFGAGGRKLFGGFGRKRRSIEASEDFCLMDAEDRRLFGAFGAGGRKLFGSFGRKRRAANETTPVCYGNKGDAMLFRYPSNQFILGGVLSSQKDTELNYINVLDYTHWIYETSKVWSDIQTQDAAQFSTSSWYDQAWTGDHLEMGLADLSKSVVALTKALPALNIIKANGLSELMNMLSNAGDIATVSGISEVKPAEFNLDNMPICGMSEVSEEDRRLFGAFGAGGRKLFGGFGRKRRSAESEACYGTSALGKFLEALSFPSSYTEGRLWNEVDRVLFKGFAGGRKLFSGWSG
jgi:hypothetical protein